jgi:PAS domain S-box-containing protein
MSDAEKHLENSRVDGILRGSELPEPQGLGALWRSHAAAPRAPLSPLARIQDESVASQPLSEVAHDFIKGQIDTDGLAGSSRHAMERRIMEEALFAEKDRAQVALECVDDGVICTDLQGNITSINLIAERMMGCSREWATGRPIIEVLHILHDARGVSDMTPRVMASFENPSARTQSQYTLIRKDGSAVPIKETAASTHDRDGRTSGSVRVFRDMSEARGSAMKIFHSAGHDFLTDLPNRMLLNERVDQAIAVARRYMQYIAVLFLDLDGFTKQFIC